MALNPVIVFVARAGVRDAPDEGVAKAWLRESLNPVIQRYEAEYGLGSRDPRFYTFIHESWKRLLQKGPHSRFFTGLIEECERENCELVLVLRGWDAITARESDFHRIFKRCSELAINVRIRVFDDDPRHIRHFFDVNVIQACDIMDGRLEPEDAAVEDHTLLFVAKMGEAYDLELDRVYGPERRQRFRDDEVGDAERNNHPGMPPFTGF